MIPEEEFNDWLQHPMTRELMRVLEAKREELRQGWEGGSFTDWEPEAMALTNVGNIGTCRGFAYVQEFDYETYLMEIENDRVNKDIPKPGD